MPAKPRKPTMGRNLAYARAASERARSNAAGTIPPRNTRRLRTRTARNRAAINDSRY